MENKKQSGDEERKILLGVACHHWAVTATIFGEDEDNRWRLHGQHTKTIDIAYYKKITNEK